MDFKFNLSTPYIGQPNCASNNENNTTNFNAMNSSNIIEDLFQESPNTNLMNSSDSIAKYIDDFESFPDQKALAVSNETSTSSNELQSSPFYNINNINNINTNNINNEVNGSNYNIQFENVLNHQVSSEINSVASSNNLSTTIFSENGTEYSAVVSPDVFLTNNDRSLSIESYSGNIDPVIINSPINLPKVAPVFNNNNYNHQDPIQLVNNPIYKRINTKTQNIIDNSPIIGTSSFCSSSLPSSSSSSAPFYLNGFDSFNNINNINNININSINNIHNFNSLNNLNNFYFTASNVIGYPHIQAGPVSYPVLQAAPFLSQVPVDSAIISSNSSSPLLGTFINDITAGASSMSLSPTLFNVGTNEFNNTLLFDDINQPVNYTLNNNAQKERLAKMDYNQLETIIRSGLNEQSIVDCLKKDRRLWESASRKPKKGSYKCAHCSLPFSTLVDFAEHLDSNKIDRAYKCPFEDCIWRYVGLPRRAELKRHCLSQHNFELPNPRNRSNSAVVKGSTGTSTSGGIRKQSPTSRSPYTSRASTSYAPRRKSTNSASERSTHIYAAPLIAATTASDDTPKFQCKICGKCPARKDSLTRHIKLCHVNKDSRYNRRMKKELVIKALGKEKCVSKL
ncbi:uncharacterized protein ASCRUDRAFT_71712 [Ascoidea rubescens DSM 1968]|uniref:C2H2-type domain-containing protein n=1 Tax=Ascoidea rubescens DSM 1968 TaxID=1344418 RepID=A0A1D2VCX2_9ASCO|nr:hypothetical protein ASCRUDRAFT_71712 [Ascoidea rubescens DSM 1968]ODV59353.1 hypothetical protein ASCRUDRAFT_71712 [Ascoidea rubescens DSM 1968]